MFGEDMLFATSKISHANSMQESPPALSARKPLAGSSSDASLWEEVESDNAAANNSLISEIDLYISQNIPKDVRTPRKTENVSPDTLSERKGGKTVPSWWKRGEDFISEDTDELELLRIRRNVSHLRLHGNYPTNIAEEHTSRTIPSFLIGQDIQQRKQEYDTLEMLEQDDQEIMAASYKFLERTRKQT